MTNKSKTEQARKARIKRVKEAERIGSKMLGYDVQRYATEQPQTAAFKAWADGQLKRSMARGEGSKPTANCGRQAEQEDYKRTWASIKRIFAPLVPSRD